MRCEKCNGRLKIADVDTDTDALMVFLRIEIECCECGYITKAEADINMEEHISVF